MKPEGKAMTEHTALRYDAHVSEPIRNSDEGSTLNV